MGPQSLSHPRKPCVIKEEVESTSLLLLRVLLKRELSRVPPNRVVWEAVIFGYL